MEALSIDSNNWLMHYPTLRRVNQCRRQIQAEFGVRVHLSDPALRDTLAHYAGHSRSRRLQEAYAELRLALIELEGPDEPAGEDDRQDQQKPRRMYRGRPVPEPDTDTEASEEGRGGESSRARTIVYRGRTLNPD